LGEQDKPGEEVRLPFCWRDVALLSSGASALRVRIVPAAEGAVSITVTDSAGQPVATVGALLTRSARAVDIAGEASAQDGLFYLDWIAAPKSPSNGRPSRELCWALVGSEDPDLDEGLGAATPLLSYADLASLSEEIESGKAEPPDVLLLRCPTAGAEPPGQARLDVASVLAAVQGLLEDERLRDARLILLTHGAMSVGAEDHIDPAAGAVWGLVRSAQSENPGRLVLIDADERRSLSQALVAAIAFMVAMGPAPAANATPCGAPEANIDPPAAPPAMPAPQPAGPAATS